MTSKKRRNKKATTTYGIIGLGRFGFALAMELADTDSGLVVLDKDEEKIGALREYTENAYVVRNLEKKTLTDTSILTVLNLVGLGVPKVIAKAASAEHGEILEKLGAEVVYPERDMAIRLAHRLEASRNLDFIQLSERLNISKTAAPAKLVGKNVLTMNLRGNYGINIIAVESGGRLIEVVKPDYVFKKDDILFLSGTKDGLNSFSDWAEQE